MLVLKVRQRDPISLIINGREVAMIHFEDLPGVQSKTTGLRVCIDASKEVKILRKEVIKRNPDLVENVTRLPAMSTRKNAI
jgi:sRNA-binding carbon storage regulator CsrA